jgi:hypothetical protein
MQAILLGDLVSVAIPTYHNCSQQSQPRTLPIFASEVFLPGFADFNYQKEHVSISHDNALRFHYS